MKDKAPLIVLIIVAAGLGLALIVVNNKARREKQELYDSLTVQSNTVTAIKTSLTEQQAVNQVLETNLASTRAEYSNKLALSDASLRRVQENLDKVTTEAKAQADATAAEIAQRDKKISDLQTQKQDVDRQSGDLRDHISSLDSQIIAIQGKLARSEGNRELLTKELKRLETEKAAWLDRFNDVAFVKVHLRRLESELAADRRLERIDRTGDRGDHKKAAEGLTHPTNNPPADLSPTLNVELHRNGQTNTPADIPPK
jgi:septal ring factor EnvC (AmiA/AmiB activator)